MSDIPVELISDGKGYFDRECPECEYVFKIFMTDWEDKTTEKAYCPRCGCVAAPTEWWTQEQIGAMQNIAVSWATNYMSKELDKTFRKMTQSNRNNKYIRITYKPDNRVTFVNNPVGQRAEWRLEIMCDICTTKYSVIGPAYFCPCCGHNSVIRLFDNSMQKIIDMLDNSSVLKTALEISVGIEKAEVMTTSIIDSCIGDVVSAFQTFAHAIYTKATGKAARLNDFQIVKKGSDLFCESIGKDYGEWCSVSEIIFLNLMFQRRHILEHNNGIIDEKYLINTDDNTYKVGQRIVVSSSDVRNFVDIIRKLSEGLKVYI